MRLRLSLFLFVIVALLCAGAAASCGGGPGGSAFDGGTGDGTTGDGALPDDGSGLSDVPILGDAISGPLTIEPLDKVVDVTSGQPVPTVQYLAKVGGSAITAAFTIDRGEIGAIAVGNGLFTPAGALGGKATVTATYKGKTVSTSVTVFVHVTQNGNDTPDGGAPDGGGAGGNGGVGGEGQGGAVPPGIIGTLGGSATTDPGLAWLYPYDKTVWPRGILAPLLQWQPGTKSYDYVYIHLVEAAYEYKGYFAKPVVSPPLAAFAHHPIPQSVWTSLAYSNGGEDVTVTLVFASGGVAYGPITETWKIAKGTLKGTVYYNSYGTNLVKNYSSGGITFGGATLAIRGGSTDPVLVAGTNDMTNGCRVCHSVASGGSVLLTEQGANYAATSSYDLKNGNTETPIAPQNGTYAWPAIYPDGTFILSDTGPLYGASGGPSALYSVPSGAAMASTGLPAGGFRAACPAFSHDGKHVAFNFYGGTGSDGKSIATLDFTQATSTFANLTTLYTPPAGIAVWPSFFPTNDAVVFELETISNGRDWGMTRSQCDSNAACSNVGAHGELWWADVKTKTATRLDNLNGKGYVPTLAATQHDDDSTLQFEPTVNPIPTGGYAWVVFTSRRLYGNISTINPYWSDPRFHDLSTSPTPKKLWVAAIDLNAPPGTDPSHPAFYLPGQELLAGNSRGYWVVDPCHPNGTTCSTGDECCGGFCRVGDGGGLVCTDQTQTCSQEFEKCTKTSDCCGAGQGIICLNGLCETPTR